MSTPLQPVWTEACQRIREHQLRVVGDEGDGEVQVKRRSVREHDATRLRNLISPKVGFGPCLIKEQA